MFEVIKQNMSVTIKNDIKCERQKKLIIKSFNRLFLKALSILISCCDVLERNQQSILFWCNVIENEGVFDRIVEKYNNKNDDSF